MLKLNSVRKLQAVLAGAVATTQPAAAVGYSDKTAAAFDGDAELHDLNGVTAVDICPAPSAGAIRQVDYLTIRNYDSAQVIVTVRVNEGGTLHNIIQATLQAGEVLGFTHAAGWYVNTADGSRKSGAQDLSAYATNAGVAAGYQPLDSDLSAIALLATTAYGRGYLALVDAAAGRTALALGTAAVSSVGDFDAAGSAAAAQDASQPLDSDLTAIAALATTPFGRALLEMADAAALRIAAGLGNVDDTADAAKPVSTAQQTALDLKANAANAALTGTPTTPTAAAATNTTQIASTAFVHSEVATAVTGLLHFHGATDCSANPNYPAAVKGDSYIVSVAGKIGGASGTAVDIGDWYIASADNAGGTEASVGASWAHLEHNLVGALLAANNLSDLANAATARTNLGLAIGTDVQAHSAALDAVSGTNTGDETGARVATLLHAATAKTTLVDADEVSGTDSAASFGLIRTTWLNAWTYIKSKADAIYQATLVSGTNIKTINSASLLGSGDIVLSASPGGSTTQLQYNNAGAFGGAAGLTTDGNVLTNTQAVTTTSTDALVLKTTSAATAGVQSLSPRLRWLGKGWKTTATAASQDVEFIAEVQPVQGTANPTGNLVFSSSINGAAYATSLTIESAANDLKLGNGGGIKFNTNNVMLAAGTLSSTTTLVVRDGNATSVVAFGATVTQFRSSTIVGWNSTTTVPGTLDIALARNAADVLEVNNGTAGAFRDLKLRAMMAVGAAATSGVGYGTGAGGAVTQLTNKSTGVTLNTPVGAITMNGASLAAGASVSFTLTSSSIGADDYIGTQRKSGGTAGAYDVWTDSVAAGSCVIRVKNNTAGALSEALVITFAVIKGAVA